MSGLEVYKNTCLCLVPKSFMKFMFSTVYSVTQKDFYARPYTSMWAPVVARQISKRYSSSCNVFISMWGVISSTASIIRCLKSARSRTFLLYTTSLRTLCTGQATYHWSSWTYNTSNAEKHVCSYVIIMLANWHTYIYTGTCMRTNLLYVRFK